jgi:hypothetical protein
MAKDTRSFFERLTGTERSSREEKELTKEKNKFLII